MTLYGIKNCDTVQKAVKWLSKNKIEFTFHDYKAAGIDEKKLVQWSDEIGWEKLLNKKSTTWRSLDAETQASITTKSKAISLMKKNTSIIKRPLLESKNKVLLLGFDEDQYDEVLK